MVGKRVSWLLENGFDMMPPDELQATREKPDERALFDCLYPPGDPG